MKLRLKKNRRPIQSGPGGDGKGFFRQSGL